VFDLHAPALNPAEEAALAELLLVHAEVDEQVGLVVEEVGARLHCGRGCSACCLDELTVLEVEALRIRARHGPLLVTGPPHPVGACAFLDEGGACRIYEDRPYVCRTQGLPLRWLDLNDDGMDVEYRDICPLNCPLNEEGTPIEELELWQCWSLGVVEPRLMDLQEALQGSAEEPLRRVPLRSLFQRSAPEP